MKQIMRKTRKKNRFFFLLIIIFIQPIASISDYDWREFYEIGFDHYRNKRYNNAVDYFHRAEGLIKKGRILGLKQDAKLDSLEPYLVFTSLGDAYANLENVFKAAD